MQQQRLPSTNRIFVSLYGLYRSSSYPGGVSLEGGVGGKHLFLFWLLFSPADIMAHDR